MVVRRRGGDLAKRDDATGWSRRSLLRAAGAASLVGGASGSAIATPGVGGGLRLTPTGPEELSARLLFLPEQNEEAFSSPPEGLRRIVVTGAYTRADMFAPGGFVIRQGVVTNQYPQGWDGVAVVTSDGGLTLHHKNRVAYRGARYDLDEPESRRAFLELATADGVSAIQSHLLITDGALDLRDRPTAARHRRRLLFQTSDGAIGIYESGVFPVTLYAAAADVLDAYAPVMALNLDMGTFNFCEDRVGEEVANCGVVVRSGVRVLTNLLELTVPATTA